jgi:hypothetical protein
MVTQQETHLELKCFLTRNLAEQREHFTSISRAYKTMEGESKRREHLSIPRSAVDREAGAAAGQQIEEPRASRQWGQSSSGGPRVLGRQA